MNSSKTRIFKKMLSVDLSLVFSFQSYRHMGNEKLSFTMAKDFSCLSLDV